MEINKITIFGLAGVGKGTTAKLLAEKLSWLAVSGGDGFRSMAKDEGMTLKEFEEACKSNKDFDLKLDKWIEDYGKQNKHFIFESRLAWYFIPDSFKIKITCNDKERIKRIQERENKTFKLVKEETEHREKAITQRYERYYGLTDWSSDSNFDFIVDTTNISPEIVVQLILERKNEIEKS